MSLDDRLIIFTLNVVVGRGGRVREWVDLPSTVVSALSGRIVEDWYHHVAGGSAWDRSVSPCNLEERRRGCET